MTQCTHQLAQAPWTQLTPHRLGVSAAPAQSHKHQVKTILGDLEKVPKAFNSHQREWLSWPPQTSHTLSADLHGTHSAPVGLPTKANTKIADVITHTEQRVCVKKFIHCPLCTSKSLGWNMFLMMTTFSCLFLASPCFSGLQSSCLHGYKNRRIREPICVNEEKRMLSHCSSVSVQHLSQHTEWEVT